VEIKKSVTCCWHCRHVFLFRNNLHRGLSFCPGLVVLTLASAFGPHF